MESIFKSARVLASIFALAIAAVQLTSQTEPPSASSVTRAVGTIKAISGNSITLTTDSGASITGTIQDSARMLRVEPGEKDLKNAAPIQLQELQVGDRMLVRGTTAQDGKSLVINSLVLMKAADVTAKQDQERSDWQKRGIGGLVNAVDVPGRSITLASAAIGNNKTVVIRVSQSTVIRRYAPDSVKFDDAKPGTLDQIKPGDQLRARGTRNSDGTELTADEIVSGTFRNIAGTVISTDSANNTLTVMDLITKKPATLKITADSQLKKLPEMVAQRIAMRLKGEGQPGGSPQSGQGGFQGPAAPGAARPDQVQAAGGSGGMGRPGGPPDFQQLLNRMPTVGLSDLQKGDAVMVVSTEGTANSQPTAVTLLSGVEPILTASPNASRAAMLLSPWNLGGAGSGADAGATQ
jgi:hypothetical protein